MAFVAFIAAGLVVVRAYHPLAMLHLWALYSAVAAILSAPIVIVGRKYVHWSKWDLLAFALPFSTWLALMESPMATGKSLANLIEPVFFSFGVPVAALMRVLVGDRVAEKVCSAVLVALLCFAAACVFWFTPPLPE